MRPGLRRKLDSGSGEALAERNKASMRSKSLPPTAIGGGASVPEGQAGVRVRQEPALAKAGVRYRGLVKNTQRLALLLGLGNLLTAERWAQIRPGSAGRANRRQPKTDWALTQGWISPQNLGVN